MKTLNLCLHCGGAEVQREILPTITLPAQTRSYQPLGHLELVEAIETALTAHDMRVVQQAHALARDGQRYFGLLQVANAIDTEDYSYVLGIRNSYDMSFPAGLVIGATVFVCDNLSFSGEISCFRKHTTFIKRDLPRITANAVGRLAEKWHEQGQRFDAYKAHPLADRDVHDLVVRAMDSGACTTTQIPHILKEWREPRHPEFAEQRNAWRLFNAFTEVGKEGSLFTMPKRTTALHGLLDSACGLMTLAE